MSLINCPYCNSEDLTMVIESKTVEDDTIISVWLLKLYALRCKKCNRIFEIEKRWRRLA